jgi:hypothetical protein
MLHAKKLNETESKQNKTPHYCEIMRRCLSISNSSMVMMNVFIF